MRMRLYAVDDTRRLIQGGKRTTRPQTHLLDKIEGLALPAPLEAMECIDDVTVLLDVLLELGSEEDACGGDALRGKQGCTAFK